jgi:antitoxin PrlF
MRQILASISSRGQVSIPVEVQRELGLKPKGKVVFEIDGGAVTLARPRFTLETVAKEEKAQHTLREMGILPE